MVPTWIFVTAVLTLELTIGSAFSLMKHETAIKSPGKPSVIKNRFSIPEGFQEGSDSIIFPDSDAERFGRYKREDRVKRQAPSFNGNNFDFNGGFPQGNNGFQQGNDDFNNGEGFQQGNNGFNNGGGFQQGNNGFNNGGGFQQGTNTFERPRPRPPPLPTRRPIGGTTRSPASQTLPTQAPARGVTDVTEAPTSGTTIAGCNCPTTPEFNPVCGQDRVTYSNLSRVRCFNRCGYRVEVLHTGACITTTTPTPSTTWTSLISGRRRS